MTDPDPRALRDAFGSYMTGVTVVTARDSGGTPVGFTANSFTSVSLDPPLVLVCPGQFLSSFATFTTCRHFAVSVLAEGQENVSNTFARFKGDRFSQIAHSFDLNGIPLIDGAIARFSCSTHQVIPAGDHSLLIGKVQQFEHAAQPGLGYVGGRYFSLGLERAAQADGTGRTVCGAIIESGETVLLEETPEGFRPPQITRPDRSQLRERVNADLSDRQMSVELGQAYSVFDDAQSGVHYVYFLATFVDQLHPAGSVMAVPIRDLPGLCYTTPAIAQMMTRFALEAGTRMFGLYLGDAQQGDIHTPSERI
jgi:flavin-dependent trigonelline monooxygenase, reductase component